MKPVSVTFIGAGNVAWHLAPALDNLGYAVREVYSRKEKNANLLAERLYHARIVDNLDFSESESKVFFLCVSDDAIEDIAKRVILPKDSILVHTSGARQLSVLSGAKVSRVGVFYPLQTFTKNRRIDFAEVPIFIESADSETEKVLSAIAKALTKKVLKISSEQRKALHVAAVFASNFSNHMLTLSKNIMLSNDLKFELLKPLIAETLNKSLEIGPEKGQTGPARRGDLEVLDSHMELLRDDERVAEIYKLISQHIIDTYEAG